MSYDQWKLFEYQTLYSSYITIKPIYTVFFGKFSDILKILSMDGNVKSLHYSLMVIPTWFRPTAFPVNSFRHSSMTYP